MKNILVLCNHTKTAKKYKKSEFDEILAINPTTPSQNLQLHIDNITHKILSELGSPARDLLEIASYVYYADCTVNRGTDTDVYADRWGRRFVFVVPVCDPDMWNSGRIRGLLRELLNFLTQDEYDFFFVPPKPRPVQLYISFPDSPPPFPGCDCISLFSGGLDSLIGSLYLLKNKNERPLLVSHRSISKMDSQQKKLTGLLRAKNKEWSFPHVSVWINRMHNPAGENTQRSRSFLYLALATAIANQLDLQKVYICENGVVSVNLPISGQNVGTLLTRSTHPMFLQLFQKLTKQIFDRDFRVENPFLFETKVDMLKRLKSWNQGELVQATISCSYTQGKTKLQPQCGVCHQCVNRRFSIAKAGLERFDRIEFYEKDIFLDSLQGGRETAYAEGYVRTAFEISKMNDTQFFSRFPELNDVVNSVDIAADECGRRLYALFQNHANETTAVAVAKCRQFQRELLAGNLPKSCLVAMLQSCHHLRIPVAMYADNIAGVLRSALRIDFQTEKPRKEPRLQEAAQAALAAADTRLRRESPMLSYSIVQTKPDFSNIADFDRLLFVELKLLNSRSKLNKIVTEITSRITIYRDQGAYVLFVVYDINDFIHDDEEFVADFEKHDRVKAIVVR